MPIRPLSTLLINQIAAGEVVERPANVAKELIENAIDAGATRIEVLVDGGGRERLRVIDDGCGIPVDELALAISPHATSKIDALEDLDAIATMGFRGEALASIGAVSRMILTSRTHDSNEGGRITVEGDHVEGPAPAGCPPGTTVDVHQLFARTPARRKFLKSDGAETRRVRELMLRLALSNPSIAFALVSGDRTLLDLSATTDPRRRVLDVLGGELDDQLIEVDCTDEEASIGIWGLVGRPAVARPTTRHLHLFLNGRPIVDRSLSHAIREAYRGLIDPGRTPTAVVFLELDPGRVDVNVHPTKTEVRLRDDRLVYSRLRHAIIDALSEHDLTAAVHVADPQDRSTPPAQREFGARRVAEPPLPLRPSGSKGFDARSAREAMDVPEAPAPSLLAVTGSIPVMQVHGSYIVAEDDDGVVIIDQHALHERIMFSTLLERVLEGPLDSQRLLAPAMVDADSEQLDGLERIGPLLAKLGIEAEAMGPAAVGIHAIPVLLLERKVDIVEFMAELLAKAGGGSLPPDEEAALQEVLDMMSCRAAVKAGEQLNESEMAELMRQRDLVERSSRCPHGRPTTLRLSLEDLEKQFGRR
ncbi:MAG: DNA mismatch repair protein MutL [Phycisphaerae bacterium]|nr:DNA mismatch repair protein MutL [Phycisphaerae bacterium]|tara:strand:- start:603 stop:2369 length:1767 start_codon:yes stop_codon:yes gene_type:complete